jgi:hypothetical protein
MGSTFESESSTLPKLPVSSSPPTTGTNGATTLLFSILSKHTPVKK